MFLLIYCIDFVLFDAIGLKSIRLFYFINLLIWFVGFYINVYSPFWHLRFHQKSNS